MAEENTKSNRKKSLSLLYSLTTLIVGACSLMCLLLLIFYIVGNYQGFQDKSQQIILNSLSYFSIFTMLLTVPVIVESIFRIITGKKKIKNILCLICMILIIIFTFFCISISSIIGDLSAGIQM